MDRITITDLAERVGLSKTPTQVRFRRLVDEGLVAPPKYLPPQFRDLNALSAWMCFSNFLNHLSLDRIEADYANIL